MYSNNEDDFLEAHYEDRYTIQGDIDSEDSDLDFPDESSEEYDLYEGYHYPEKYDLAY